MEIFVVVDMQYDFVYGSLGTEEAKAIVPNVVKKVNEWKGKVIYTLDTHEEDYLTTQEGRLLPISHCIRGTKGQEIIDDLKATEHFCDALFFEKNTFGSVELAQYLKQLAEKEEIEQITFAGVCTDICVVSNALMVKAYLTETPVAVSASCCAGLTPEKHRNALDVMASCQIEVVE